MNKMTRQGVRDLSHLKGKSVGKTLPIPPEQEAIGLPCNHRNAYELGDGQYRKCPECDALLKNFSRR